MDSKDCLRAWAESLGGITYPLLSDFYPHGRVAELYGVLRAEGKSERGLFVIDKQGVVRYVDVHDIDSQPDNEVLFGVLGTLEPKLAAAWQAREAAERAKELESPSQPVVAASGGSVVMYCTPWCPACRRARAFLSEHGVAVQEIDISRDRAAAQRVRGWANGYETTPTFDVNGTIQVNFDQAKLSRLLGL